MSNEIGIVFNGYLDENSKLMVRSELNARIASIKRENKKLQEVLGFYANESNYDWFSFEDKELIVEKDNGEIARQALKELGK